MTDELNAAMIKIIGGLKQKLQRQKDAVKATEEHLAYLERAPKLTPK